MKATILLTLAISVAGCSSAERQREDALMNRIEASARLPTGALPLRAYARHYREFEDSTVGVLYEVPAHLPNGDWSLGVAPNERRWYGRDEDVPMVLDGGCSVLTARYNPTDNAFIAPMTCHARA